MDIEYLHIERPYSFTSPFKGAEFVALIDAVGENITCEEQETINDQIVTSGCRSAVSAGYKSSSWDNSIDMAFLGYDLIDSVSGISALTNCGGFSESFDNQELNRYGLISEYPRAKQIQTALLINNPDEPHADTEFWAIWKLEE